MVRRGGFLLIFLLFGAAPAVARADAPPVALARVEAALQNVSVLERPGRDGYAAVWDGNKYIQCRRLADQALRCEAAGARMQTSLGHVLTQDRLAALAALGWVPDPSFGNFIQEFPADAPLDQVADRLLRTLSEAYDADLDNLEVETNWVVHEPCPPRNGPSQNLAGLANDAPAMAATAVHACAYAPEPDLEGSSADDLFDAYGPQVTGEIQRLRVNPRRDVFVILQANPGYVQCQPETSPPAIYCEAQSADSWPALARLLTPQRIARLHAVGFADPGRAPNYWKLYPLDQFSDEAVARELLTILHDVYGYDGDPELEVKAETR